MKKIMAAAAVASLLAGSAFAELSFSYTGEGIFGTTTKAVNKVARNDCFCLELANEVAGVHVDWDIASDAPYLDSFYGWMTFGLPVGNLQVTSGKWNARYSDRVNTDGGDLGNDRFKLGNIIDDTASNDADNLTEGAMSSVLAYTLDDALPGALLAKFGIVSTADKDDKAKSTSYFNGTVSDPEVNIFCGFVGELAYRQEKAFNFDLAIKHLNANVTTVGAYFSPLMAEALEATAGFTYGYNTSTNTEIAFDLRARYAITEKVALTGMFNFSQVKVEDVDDPTKAMWAGLTLNYVAGENIRFFVQLNNTVTDFLKPYGACDTHFTPACEISVSDKAVVTTAVDFDWDNSGATGLKPFSGTAQISIPLYVTLSY
ncbi:MAG: hypothetical protein K6B43_09785 [Treponema sp.]|nr:hypothetical protein [Treponema sp.]